MSTSQEISTLRPYSASALGGQLTVTATLEGSDIHLERNYGGQVQHKFRRAWERTEDELSMAVHMDLAWLTYGILKAAEDRMAIRDPKTDVTE